MKKLILKKKSFRMTKKRHIKLVKEIALVINSNSFENYINMPDYAIAEEMVNFIYRMKRNYKRISQI